MSRPILFMKVGVPGSEPLGFYDQLVETYQTDRVSTEEIRLELGQGEWLYGKQMANLVRDTADERAAAALGDGFHVFYDGYVNARWRRDAIMEKVVKPIGAGAVILGMHAPWEVVDFRLIERRQHDQLGVPVWSIDSWQDFKDDMQDMYDNIDWPDADEPRVMIAGTSNLEQAMVRLERFVLKTYGIAAPEQL